MKDSLLKILVCPICHGLLELRDAKRNGEEIISGLLHCGKCNHSYKIADGIPDMLSPNNCSHSQPAPQSY